MCERVPNVAVLCDLLYPNPLVFRSGFTVENILKFTNSLFVNYGWYKVRKLRQAVCLSLDRFIYLFVIIKYLCTFSNDIKQWYQTFWWPRMGHRGYICRPKIKIINNLILIAQKLGLGYIKNQEDVKFFFYFIQNKH